MPLTNFPPAEESRGALRSDGGDLAASIPRGLYTALGPFWVPQVSRVWGLGFRDWGD